MGQIQTVPSLTQEPSFLCKISGVGCPSQTTPGNTYIQSVPQVTDPSINKNTRLPNLYVTQTFTNTIKPVAKPASTTSTNVATPIVGGARNKTKRGKRESKSGRKSGSKSGSKKQKRW